jgi:hypothetical protein
MEAHGHKVFFIHLRRKDKDGKVSNFGGKTVAYISLPNGTIISASAVCRAIGRAIAVARLEKIRLLECTADNFVENTISSWPY